MADSKFMRGAKPSPRFKLLAAAPHFVVMAPPPQVAMVPRQLSVWGNDRYGDCVTAEEAFAIAAYSTFCGTTERFVPEATVIAWARKYGFLNGAGLTEVMDRMASVGLNDGVQIDKDGPYKAVDYSNEANLQSAISVGPVKIAIDADALPNGAGNKQGWYSTGKGHYPRTDHCVSLSGYGPAEWLYQQLNVQLPSALAGRFGYLLFTWSTIGFVDHDWLMGTCTEAWVRNPTTLGLAPSPTPTPTPTPTPIPSGGIAFGQFLKFNADGTYTLGSPTPGPGLDPMQLIAIINAILAAFGLPPLRSEQTDQVMMASSAGAIPWAKVIQIGMLVFGWISGGSKPEDLPALIQKIISILQG